MGERRAESDSDSLDAPNPDERVTKADVPWRVPAAAAADVATRTSGAQEPAEPYLAPGSRVGRYRIAGVLGEGGMGVVYQAVDPELGRSIALKLHRLTGADERARTRLLREAQALAQLSHPNVIAVFDAGFHDGDVFVAMELAPGETLRTWLTRTKPPLRDVLRMLAAAGRGLQAAHAAGLVHRDIKPANILIGEDGRVRVIDFGLARAPQSSADTLDTGSADSEDEPSSDARSDDLLHSPLTQAGSIVGTPGYMAPEQYLALAVDHRTDQYSFAVVLYEALFGERPFRAKSRNRLRERVLQGLDTLPKRRGMPRRLRRALIKALARDPSERFPSLAPLLAVLEREPTAWKRWVAATSAVSIVAATALVLASRQPAASCGDASDRLVGVWDADVAERVRQSMAASDVPYAMPTFERVQRSLDAYTDRWSQMHRATCEATNVRGTQSSQLLDMRMSCLDRRLDEVRALARVLTSTVDATVMERATTAAANLGQISSCADTSFVASRFPPPDDPQQRAVIESLWSRMSEVEAESRLGRYETAYAANLQLLKTTEELAFPPLRATIMFQLAMLESALGRSAEAEAVLNRALPIAAAAADDELVANAWIQLLFLKQAQAQVDEALLQRPAAEAAVKRAGDAPQLRAELASAVGTLLFSQGKYAEAVSEYRASIPLYIEAVGESSQEVARARSNLSQGLRMAGDAQGALEEAERALQITREVVGDEHPDVSHALYTLGYAYGGLGDDESALEMYQQSLAMRQELLGADHPLVVQTAQSVGSTLGRLGRIAEARPYLLRALAAAEALNGEDHPDLAYALNNIGATYTVEGRDAEALPYFRRALALREKALGATHPLVAASLSALAVSALAAGRADEAADAAERGLAIEATAALAPELAAQLVWSHAQARWQLGSERGKALELARRARTQFRQLGDTESAELVESWLAAR